ncbi:MAG TPA: hypothetical protein VJR89_36670, partial [Polyangiales bacterium]|nr:hypothetical protein [Polyangiales bacterium]
VDAQVRVLLEQLAAQLEAARSSEAERLRSLDAQISTAHERERQQLEQLDALSNQVGAELARLSSELTDQWQSRQASEQSHDARAERVVEQLSAACSAVERSAAEQQASLEQLVERLPPLFGAAAETSAASTQRALEQLVESSERRLSEVSQLFADETRGWGERALSALQRVDRSADLLDDAIARQGQGMSELLERVAQLLPELSAAAQSGAASTVTQLRELAEQQATRWLELERSLDRGRELQARAFADELTSHAAELESRLTRTGEAVHEAAAIWQSSSAEMQAVAQLFASSVERQREASDAWLESLGQIEAAVEHAGRRSASDALADQLASTHELFARQLQFQRELFEQLRGLRGSTAAPRVNGGRNVSAAK